MALVNVEIDSDQLIEIIRDIKDDLSTSDKKKILEILFKGRGVTDSGRLLAEIADTVYNG